MSFWHFHKDEQPFRLNWKAQPPLIAQPSKLCSTIKGKNFAPTGANSLLQELNFNETGGNYENGTVAFTEIYPFTLNYFRKKMFVLIQNFHSYTISLSMRVCKYKSAENKNH